MYEENLKQIAKLLRDFLACNHCTRQAHRFSHLGWPRWERCLKDEDGTLPEYLSIWYAIRKADRQHSQQCSIETEQLTDALFTILRSFDYDEMDIAIIQLDQCRKHKRKKKYNQL